MITQCCFNSKKISNRSVSNTSIRCSWCMGYVEMFKGKVIKNYFSEEDDEIEDLIDEKGIDIPIYMFREVIREKGEGWDIVQINN